MTPTLEEAYNSLYEYCRSRDFAGFDPFDGLGSPLFGVIPFGRSKPVRLGFQQIVKRSPWNLRPLLLIRPGENAKAIALFAIAEIVRGRTSGRAELHRANAVELISRLNRQAVRSGDTLAFGYNFDWQSRAFFAPKGSPTIVPTAFAARAYLAEYDASGDVKCFENAAAICRFITDRLDRPIDDERGVCFSYTPGSSSVIYNASLLAAETLAETGRRTGNREYAAMAQRAADFVVSRQQSDGSWRYGDESKFGWIDNFHTAYVLESLYRIDPAQNRNAIARGFDYWLGTFFLDNGGPRYFHDETYPLDIHSAAVAVASLVEMKDADERALPMAERVADWALKNMRDPQGFFYYQQRRRKTIKTPFIRWSQAWMAYALAKLIDSRRP